MTREKTSGIYCIENVENGMKYIGCAKDICARWRVHKSDLDLNRHCNKYLQAVYNKYGKNIFKYYVIQELECDGEILMSMEVYWIAYYNSYFLDGGGYNLTRGADGWWGKHHSEETKKILSEKATGRIASDEARKNMSIAGKGRKMSEEAKKKMSKFQKGKKVSDKTKALLASYCGEKSHQFGKKHTDETKKKISLAHMGKKKNKKTSSLHVGVTYVKSIKKWRARITYNNKRIHLGSYDYEDDAIKAYESADFEIKNNIFDYTKYNNKRITKESVLKIKYLLNSGVIISEIMKEVDICRNTIIKVKNGGYDLIYNLSIWSEVT